MDRPEQPPEVLKNQRGRPDARRGPVDEQASEPAPGQTSRQANLHAPARHDVLMATREPIGPNRRSWQIEAVTVLLKLLAHDDLPDAHWSVHCRGGPQLGGIVDSVKDLNEWAAHLRAHVTTTPISNDDRLLLRTESRIDGVRVEIACLAFPSQL